MATVSHRHIRQIDISTGEIIEGVYAITPVRRKNGFQQGGWFAMSQEAIAKVLDLTIQQKVTLRDLQTLYALLEVLDIENWIRVSQKHLAERLNMLQPNVSRSIRVLIELGIILIGPKVGTSRTYRLAPSFGWKGGARQHNDALKDMRNRMDRAGIKGVIDARDPQTVDMFTGKADIEEL